MNYKTYAEAKIANPDCEIVTTAEYWKYGKGIIGTFEARVLDGDGGAHIIEDTAWKICHPTDHCSTLKEFLDAGFKLAIGDLFLGTDGTVHDIEAIYPQTNKIEDSDDKRYILSAAALNGGCKITSKSEIWTIYNNTMPLSELSDEQAARLFNAWRAGGDVEFDSDCGEWLCADDYLWIGGYVYRIKQKSERELFINKSMEVCKENQHNKVEFMLGKIYDAGARYSDLTQHFGENI